GRVAFLDLSRGLLAAVLLLVSVREEHRRLAPATPAECQETCEDERHGLSGLHFASLGSGHRSFPASVGLRPLLHPRTAAREGRVGDQTRERSARTGGRFGAGWKRQRRSVRSRSSTYAPITIR